MSAKKTILISDEEITFYFFYFLAHFSGFFIDIYMLTYFYHWLSSWYMFKKILWVTNEGQIFNHTQFQITGNNLSLINSMYSFTKNVKRWYQTFGNLKHEITSSKKEKLMEIGVELRDIWNVCYNMEVYRLIKIFKLLQFLCR